MALATHVSKTKRSRHACISLEGWRWTSRKVRPTRVGEVRTSQQRCALKYASWCRWRGDARATDDFANQVSHTRRALGDIPCACGLRAETGATLTTASCRLRLRLQHRCDLCLQLENLLVFLEDLLVLLVHKPLTGQELVLNFAPCSKLLSQLLLRAVHFEFLLPQPVGHTSVLLASGGRPGSELRLQAQARALLPMEALHQHAHSTLDLRKPSLLRVKCAGRLQKPPLRRFATPAFQRELLPQLFQVLLKLQPLVLLNIQRLHHLPKPRLHVGVAAPRCRRLLLQLFQSLLTLQPLRLLSSQSTCGLLEPSLGLSLTAVAPAPLRPRQLPLQARDALLPERGVVGLPLDGILKLAETLLQQLQQPVLLCAPLPLGRQGSLQVVRHRLGDEPRPIFALSPNGDAT
mmetsp:Transcript_14890/g.52228  ORF Transcript_14890/g.52228 Transcript_14890/m.52228 type:complete len:405 (+) Transcript_14890:930-2144(+)